MMPLEPWLTYNRDSNDGTDILETSGRRCCSQHARRTPRVSATDSCHDTSTTTSDAAGVNDIKTADNSPRCTPT